MISIFNLSSHALNAGTRLGPYQVVSTLGAGGIGVSSWVEGHITQARPKMLMLEAE